AKASEMEHALRFHIRKNFDEDPARYTKLSERLENILNTLSGQWDQLALALEELIGDATNEHGTDQVHADPLVTRFYGVLEAEFASSDSLSDEVRLNVVHLAEELVTEVVARARVVRFWRNAHAQDALRNQLIHILDDHDLIPFEEQASVADKLMELARANQSLIAARVSAGEEA
ncbi:MAG: restriction endonuclease subunit R, partial [Actinobacteria bacterium]|nr:restriction endonuclease subunit R [Actinomycetota bacterium]